MDTQERGVALLALIRSEPDADDYVFEWDGGWHVTTEWLVGTFAGCGFAADSPEGAAALMVEYLDEHVDHPSVVGRAVADSGWPDLRRVARRLKEQREEL